MYYHGLNRTENNMNENKVSNSHEYEVCNTPEDENIFTCISFLHEFEFFLLNKNVHTLFLTNVMCSVAPPVPVNSEAGSGFDTMVKLPSSTPYLALS